MKTCFKCGETKVIGEFYAHPQMADGHLNKCKTCTKRDSRETAIKNGPERERSYRNAYIKRKHVRDRMNDYLRRQRVIWPEKIKARAIIDKLLMSGELKRQPCEVCGIKERIHAHHPNYSKPLEVRWLCAKHHKAEHMRLAQEEQNDTKQTG